MGSTMQVQRAQSASSAPREPRPRRPGGRLLAIPLGRGSRAGRLGSWSLAVELELAALALAALALAGCLTRAQEPAAGSGAVVAGSEFRAATTAPVTSGSAPILLAPALERRVVALVEEARDAPSTAANFAERTDVLWEWANALARAGVAIPHDLPFTVTFLRWAEADGGEVEPIPEIELPLPLHLARLDGYIEELASLGRGERPGRLRFSSAAPLVSRSRVDLELIFTVEDLPVETGGAFFLGARGGPDAHLQNSDPAAPAYVTARASRPDVVLERTTAAWNGVDSSVLGMVRLPAFRVASGVLERGDAVTFTLGDRSQGSPGLRAPLLSIDALRFPVYVDPDGSGHFRSVEAPVLEVVGAPEVHRVRVLAPSVVAPGERFAIAVRSEDEAMNRASGEIPGYEVLRGGEVIARVEGGGPALVQVGGVAIDEPGTHRLVVRSADGRHQAISNPIWVRPPGTAGAGEAAAPWRILWGDTHGHTGMSEGQGSARSFFAYAKSDARLDFVTLSEHDLWMDDGEWRELQALAREHDEPGRFAAILGYEWTAFPNRGGHHNVLLRDPAAARVGVQDAGRLEDLYRGLRAARSAEEVLVIPHAHMAGDWRRSDPDLERLVELYSVHGSFESFANAYLRQGWEVGVVAAGDDHRAKPGLAPPAQGAVAQPGGLAAVLAPAATREDVFAALRARRTYATSGERIVLDATLNGYAFGTRQPATERRELRLQVMGTAPIERVDVVRDGGVVHSHSFLTTALAARSVVQVSFESSTELGGPVHDSPRGSRPWRGTLEVAGARVLGVEPAGLDNPLRERVRVEDAAAGRVSFALLTRGRADSFLLELEGVGPETELRFRLAPGREAGAPSTLRGQREIPGAELAMRLEDLVAGRLEHELRLDGHVDRVALQVLDPAGALDRSFEWVDLDAGSPPEDRTGDRAGARPRAGSYYYVRVTQLDGARAWSSPWWVGAGESSR